MKIISTGIPTKHERRRTKMRTLSTFAIAALLLVDINAKSVTLTAGNVESAMEITNAINVATNRGKTKGTVIFDGKDGPFHYKQEPRSIRLGIKHVTIRGINGAIIDNCGDGFLFVSPRPDYFKLINMGFRCDRTALGNFGTVLRESGGNTPNHVVIRGNVMYGKNGLFLGDGKDWLIADNTIIAPGPEGKEPWMNGHALIFGGADHFMIRNNIIYAKFGIWLEGNDGPNTNTVIKENQITANNAIYLVNTTKSEILRNNMCIIDITRQYGSGTGGIYTQPDSKNNRIISNKGFSGSALFQVVGGTDFDHSTTVVRNNIISLEACIPFVIGGSSEPGVCWS
jgi:hypothetical protein